MEEGLMAGFYLSISALAAGTILGAISVIFYSALWFVRDK